ncbi:cytochrome b [Allorhizobium undicola]|uniref:cytochrome b n=1 Tax=Allorhizobium undicola TaxID=78527 RepID=UPI000489E83D|nr:cytochrome b/b6 domain-containing protein [Allorhizobium undicola]
MNAIPVTGYSVAQRVLHWLMALLIFFNLIFSDGMEHWNRLARRGETITPDDIASANIHAYVGIAILILCLIRLFLRFTQGAPLPPESEPPLLKLAAKVTHATLYLLFFAMPLTGIAKYYFGIGPLGGLHGGILKMLLWVLIGLHVAGALVHQFYWKTNVLARMTKGA